MKKFGLSFLFLCLSWAASGQSGEVVNRLNSQGQKEGLWVKYYDGSKGMRYAGQFSNGIPVGTFVHYHPNGVVKAEMVYRAKTGVCRAREYSMEGKRIAEGVYTSQSTKDSVWVYYRQSGEKIQVESYEKGLSQGVWNLYYLNGNCSETHTYTQGKKEGPWVQYFENGQLKWRGNYLNDTLNGPVESFDWEGKILFKGEYKNGLPSGTWTFFENGKVVRQEVYRSGKRIKSKTF